MSLSPDTPTPARKWLSVQPEHISFPGHASNVVTCLQVDRDKIISASDDHSIQVYSTANGQLRGQLNGHQSGVWALQYVGDTLVSGSTDRTVRVWDLGRMEIAHVFHGHTSTVRSVQIVEPILDQTTKVYFPPYPMIVTGSRDSTIRVWKLPMKSEPPLQSGIPPEENRFHIHCLKGHSQAVRVIAAHGRICVSGSYDYTVRVWDIVTGQCKHVLSGHEQKVYSLVYDHRRNQCSSGSMDNSIKVWDITTGECLHTLVGHTSLVGLLGVSLSYLVSASADETLRVWDADTKELRHTLSPQSGAISCFQHDDVKVVSGSGGLLKLWDVHTGAHVCDLLDGSSSVWQVAFNGNILVAASKRNGSTVLDVFTFAEEDSRETHGSKLLWPSMPMSNQSTERAMGGRQ